MQNVQKRQIHIVGCLPRSGTTLLTELMVNCFEIDAFTEHEYSIFKAYPKPYHILCTKKPNDIKRVRVPLLVNPDLYVIYVLRDPRDAISSRSHQGNNQNKNIWGNLGTWLKHHQIAESLAANPRFFTVKYEDLVSAPDAMQAYIQDKLPFLTKRVNFSDFHKVAKPSGKSIAALGGARPISTASIGNWRARKPYIKAQVERYSKAQDNIANILVRIGYEKDTSWLDELSDVIADNTEEPKTKKSRFKAYWSTYFTQSRRELLYRIRHIQPFRALGSKFRRVGKRA